MLRRVIRPERARNKGVESQSTSALYQTHLDTVTSGIYTSRLGNALIPGVQSASRHHFYYSTLQSSSTQLDAQTSSCVMTGESCNSRFVGLAVSWAAHGQLGKGLIILQFLNISLASSKDRYLLDIVNVVVHWQPLTQTKDGRYITSLTGRFSRSMIKFQSGFLWRLVMLLFCFRCCLLPS